MTAPTSRRVVITQPYVPAYRERLLGLVVAGLAEVRVDTHVFYGGDVEQMRRRRERGDLVEPPWATEVPVRTVRVGRGGRHLLRRVVPPGWRDAVLVTEMQAGNLDALSAALRGRPYVTWGHGASYTADEVGLAERWEAWLNRRARHVLTYTDAGRRHVVETARVPADRVTSFGNSTDTRTLRRERDALDAGAVDAYRAALGLPADARAALLLGALNEHKLPELVVETARTVLRRDPAAWLLVAGDGPARGLFEGLAAETGRVVLLGQVDARGTARAAAVSRVLLNPGRVGLVAVDALVLGLPVLTSDAGRHAPEIEYLTEGSDLFTVPATPTDLADAWLRLTAQDRRPRTDGEVPSTEAAAERIVRAVHAVVMEAA
ncbi:glycosyltransferase [Cellulosimicrobium funkei]|uniref:glycosyltransferase n=1 Tax=Cellulosimicrobium funkei TaxID=264251 RepID=UPI00364DF20F